MKSWVILVSTALMLTSCASLSIKSTDPSASLNWTPAPEGVETQDLKVKTWSHHFFFGLFSKSSFDLPHLYEKKFDEPHPELFSLRIKESKDPGQWLICVVTGNLYCPNKLIVHAKVRSESHLGAVAKEQKRKNDERYETP
ncbi:MAG: hypothetical protein R3A11_02675 [Bdellovibrionota bacterium]